MLWFKADTIGYARLLGKGMNYELNENHSLKEMCVLSPLFIHMMNSSVSLAW
jgi:hypothetical protein